MNFNVYPKWLCYGPFTSKILIDKKCLAPPFPPPSKNFKKNTEKNGKGSLPSEGLNLLIMNTS